MSVHLSFTAHIFLSPIKKLIKPSNSSVDQIELLKTYKDMKYMFPNTCLKKGRKSLSLHFG